MMRRSSSPFHFDMHYPIFDIRQSLSAFTSLVGRDHRIPPQFLRFTLAPLAILLFACALCLSPARAADNANEEELRIESAEYVRYERETRTTTLRGNVEFKYRDTTIQAQEAVVNEKYKTATAVGHVVIVDPNGNIVGDTLFYDYDKEYFEITNPVGSTTSSGVTGRMYYTGRIAKGTRNKIRIHHGEFTTCDPYCTKEYHITAREITVYPKIKVTARAVTFYIKQVPAFYMPFYYASLKEKKQQDLPAVGYNKVEGYFVKARQAYMARELITGILLLNYMSRKGTGWGAEHSYTSRRLGGAGSNRFYTKREKDTGNSSNEVRVSQQFKAGPTTTGSLNFSRNSAYSVFQNRSRTNSSSVAVNLSRIVNIMQGASGSAPVPAGQKMSQTLNYVYSAQHGIFQQSNKNINYIQMRQFRGRVSTNTNINFTENGQSFFPKTRQMNLNMTAIKTHNLYQWNYLLQRTYDLSERAGVSPGYFADIRPELTLSLMPALYNKWFNPRWLPLTTMNASYGNYWEGTHTNSRHMRRYATQMTASRSWERGKATLTPTQDYRQYFYMTKDAMYVMSRNVDFKYQFATPTALGINYSLVQTTGGMPFSRDIGGASHYMRTNLTSSHPRTNFILSTGYNYKSHLYDPLAMQYTRGMSKNSTLNFATSYELNNSIWSPTVTGLLLSRKHLRLNMNGVWDTKELDFRNGSATMEMWRRNGWRFQTRAIYERRALYPIAREIIAVKTNCCTEIQMAWHAESKFFEFHYVVLAFPGSRVGFTSSNQGLQMDQNLMPQNLGIGGPGQPGLF